MVPPSNDDWEAGLTSRDRIELLVDEMRDLIACWSSRTGRRFDEARLLHLMERINEQEGYIAEASTCHRRSAALPGIDRRADAQYDDPAVASRLGLGGRRMRGVSATRCSSGSRRGRRRHERACPPDVDRRRRSGTIRASTGAGGASSARCSSGRCTCHSRARNTSAAIEDRPMEALASRICSMNEVLHLPPWMNGWMVSEAKRCAHRCGGHAAAARQPSVAVRHQADRARALRRRRRAVPRRSMATWWMPGAGAMPRWSGRSAIFCGARGCREASARGPLPVLDGGARVRGTEGC